MSGSADRESFSADWRERQFRDEQGKNPFADQASEAAPAGDLFAPPAAPIGSLQPRYEQALPHRGPMLLKLAIAMFLAAVATGLSALFIGGVAILLPFLLVLVVPLLVISWSDLRAMRRGAMDATGRKAARWAVALSSLTTVALVALTAWYALRLLQLIWFRGN